jgi:hypothetical protein
MSVAISSALEAHQRGNPRRPAVSVSVSAARGGMEILRWERLYTGGEPDAPHAFAIAPDGSLIRARNDSGELAVARVANPGPGSGFSSWSNIAACATGTGVALASSATELLLASVQPCGLTVEVRRSLDNGVTWSAQSVVTEASAVGSLAIALNPSGDACLFYTLGTSTTLKRLRRAGGTWASSGTNWSRASSVASLSGVAACHDGADFALLITGTEVSTNHHRCWAARMGDLGLPANAWSSLTAVAEADAASTITFASPAIAAIGGSLRGAFSQRNSGPVAENRVMETRPMAGTGAGGWWSEPVPHEASVDEGFALASTSGAIAWAASPSGVWRAPRNLSRAFDERVVSCRYALGPREGHCTVELADPANDLLADPALFPGSNIMIAPGYAPAGSPESGVALEFAIERIERRALRGGAIVTIEASGPWALARAWRAPQSWQSPAGSMTRAQLFLRTAARAGLVTADVGGARQPLGEWTSDSPAFALGAGETAASALDRLLAAISAEVIPDSGLLVTAVSADDATDGCYGGSGQHPVFSFEPVSAGPDADWVRLQGAGRSADAFDSHLVFAGGGGLTVINDHEATSDAAATSRAAAALRRALMVTPCARLRIPFDAARQLWDVIEITGERDGLAAERFRMIGIEADYRRGPAGSRYEQTLILGGMS